MGNADATLSFYRYLPSSPGPLSWYRDPFRTVHRHDIRGLCDLDSAWSGAHSRLSKSLDVSLGIVLADRLPDPPEGAAKRPAHPPVHCRTACPLGQEAALGPLRPSGRLVAAECVGLIPCNFSRSQRPENQAQCTCPRSEV